MAIESVAALANAIHTLMMSHSNPKPSTEEIAKALKSFQTCREKRVKNLLPIANTVTRLEALKGPKEELMALHVMPRLGEFLINRTSHHRATSEKLQFLPEPERALNVTMPYNPKHGQSRSDHTSWRSLMASPLAAIAILAWYLSNRPAIDGHTSDSAFFEVLPITLIWILESYRRVNAMTLLSLPVLFTAALLKYDTYIITTVAIWAFYHYIESPLSGFEARDQRIIKVAAARSTLPALILAAAVWLCLPMSGMNEWCFSLLFMVLQPLTQRLVKDTTREDRLLRDPTTDLPSIRLAVQTVSVFSALAFNYARLRSDVSAMAFTPSTVLLLWMCLLFIDLKNAQWKSALTASWTTRIGSAVLGCALIGPGAMFCAAWGWREEVLADRGEPRPRLINHSGVIGMELDLDRTSPISV